jgi:hypothetical protein
VLVATDAVGMGLNLNIRRVVFHAMDKFDGEAVGPVPPAHVKQIAGRAGRRSSRFPRGWATALHPADLPYLHACLAAPPAPIAAAGLFPNAEQLIRFAELLPADTPAAVLQGILDVVQQYISVALLDEDRPPTIDVVAPPVAKAAAPPKVPTSPTTARPHRPRLPPSAGSSNSESCARRDPAAYRRARARPRRLQRGSARARHPARPARGARARGGRHGRGDGDAARTGVHAGRSAGWRHQLV